MPANVLMFEFLAVDHFGPVAEHVGKKLDGIGERMGSIGKVAALAIGKVAVGGLAAFGYEMVKGVAAAAEYQTLQLKTAAVIKSTGNAAHISVAGVDELAHSLQETSGVSESLIINSENVLATFTNIRNTAGKNNDIYNQATSSILDLSVAMGEDLQSATVQVGKALNDPIKGMTALQRVGVTFNATQKEQIKHLASTGHLMAAQKIILKELAKEFGGAAKAAGAGFGGALARVKESIEDTFRDMATKLLPVLTVAANWLADRLPGAIRATGNVLGALGGWLIRVGTAFANLGRKYLPPVISYLKIFIGFLAGLVQRYGPTVIKIVQVIGEKLSRLASTKLAFAALAGAVGGLLIPVLGVLVGVLASVAVAVWSVIAPLLPFLAIGAAIGVVAYLIVSNWSKVSAVFRFFAPLVSIVAHYFRDMLFPALRDAAAKIFPQIKIAIATVSAAFRDHMDVIRTFGQVFMFILKVVGVALAVLALIIVKVLIPVIAELIVIVLKSVGPIVRALLSITGVLITVIKGIVGFSINAVKTIANVIGDIIGAFSNAKTWLINAGAAIISGLIRGVEAVWPHLVAAARHTIDFFLGPFKPALFFLFNVGKFIIRGLINGVSSLFGWFRGKVSSFISFYIRAPFNSAVRWLTAPGYSILRGLWSGILSFTRRLWDGIKWVIGRIKAPFANAFNFIFNAGWNIVRGLLSGIGAAIRGVAGWINAHVVQPIIGAVKWFFGISSPSRVMMSIGGHLIGGLIAGLVKHNPIGMVTKIFGGMPQALGSLVHKGIEKLASLPAKAFKALAGLGGTVLSKLGISFGNPTDIKGFGAGVKQWAGIVNQALQMEGLSPSLLGTVLSQMQTESGGNPYAINLWDSNAKAGTPSKGLMQVIDPTFRAFHWPGTSWDIYNAFANVAAALNYARHRYGSDLSALGHGHGYDTGGIARGKGWFGKFTSAPERILSPRQTEWFERAMAHGTRGGGYGGGGHTTIQHHYHFPNYVGNSDDLFRAMYRGARQGRMDSIVRLAK